MVGLICQGIKILNIESCATTEVSFFFFFGDAHSMDNDSFKLPVLIATCIFLDKL